MKSPSDPVQRIFAFAKERYSIYEKRVAGEPPPWTKDEILGNYRFTNVYREDDKVTLWIAQNWREPHSNDPDLWFAMCVARIFNRIDCLEMIGWPIPLDPMLKWRLKKRQEYGEKIFSAAYIISTNGIAEDKTVYQIDRVITPLWEQRKRLRPSKDDTLQSYHILLGQMQGFGSFLTAQVIADLKYADGCPLSEAKDWWTFAASGPGSRRGLARIFNRSFDDKWQEDEWRLKLGWLHEELIPMFKSANMPKPHAQDIQNLLCEFDKYERARLNEGRPKQRYRVEGVVA